MWVDQSGSWTLGYAHSCARVSMLDPQNGWYVNQSCIHLCKGGFRSVMLSWREISTHDGLYSSTRMGLKPLRVGA